jgi:SEC-C motif-containing protein
MMGVMFIADCPCGTGQRYDVCCGRLHRRAAEAETAEELMRSRYTGYALGELDHVWRTWHPRTRPTRLTPDPERRWTGLEILDATTDGDQAEVEFRASFEQHGTPGIHHERSAFERRRGRWVYVEPVD